MTSPANAAPEENDAPTLELREAIFRTQSGVTTSPVSLRSSARRVGLIGDFAPLFRALQGEAAIASGSVRLVGVEARAALARGFVGVAPCDPPLPAAFSVREYLEHAARLGHGSRARAATEAQRTLEDFGLSELAAQKLALLAPFQRRALGVALAALSGPAVVCLETPLQGLDAPAADYVARLCAHVAERSLLVVSVARPSTPSAERTLLGACEDLFVLRNGVLVLHGPPSTVFAPGARYVLTVVGSKTDELMLTLKRASCELTPQPAPSAFGALLAPGKVVERCLVELPERARPDLLLDAAVANGVTVLELEPLFDG